MITRYDFGSYSIDWDFLFMIACVMDFLMFAFNVWYAWILLSILVMCVTIRITS